MLLISVWFDMPRFKGITLFSPREVAEQQGTIEPDYRVAADAVEGFFGRLRNRGIDRQPSTIGAQPRAARDRFFDLV